MPGHEDMQQILVAILVVAEPMMVMIVAYFVLQFSFSRIAQNLGGKNWFVWVVAVPCIYTFICSVASLFPVRSSIMIDYMYYSPVLWFVVQPVTVYLTISHTCGKRLSLCNLDGQFLT